MPPSVTQITGRTMPVNSYLVDCGQRVLDAVRPLVPNESLLFLTRLSIEPALAALHTEKDVTSH